jgi:hypothetical protein
MPKRLATGTSRGLPLNFVRRARCAAQSFIEPLEERIFLSNSWFVAPGGNDAGTGTLAQPFQTIQHAAALAQFGDTVLIRSGTYRETVHPASGGVTFENYNGEKVTVSGADIIGGWSKYNGSIYQTQMPQTLGDGNNQVFVDGQMINEARWPNTSLDPSNPNLAHISSYSAGLIRDPALTQPANYWRGATIHITPGQQWVAYTGTVFASGPGWLRVSLPSLAGSEAPTAGNAYYLYGAFSGLDSAGEWYRSAPDSMLYAWMPASDTPAAHVVEVKDRQFAFDLSGDRSITIQGINLFAATIKTNQASQNLTLNQINAQYLSQFGAIPNGWTPPTSSGIELNGAGSILENSTIAYSAGDGVYIGAASVKVTRNTIHDIDYSATDSAAINDRGASSTTMFGNTIYNTGRSGIMHRVGGVQIINNTIHDVSLQTTDAGGTYTFGTDGRGSMISNNVIYNIHSGGFGSTAIFLDNNSSNFTVRYNKTMNVDTAIKLNFSSYNEQVYNNQFGATRASVSTQSGSSDWSGSVFSNNVFYAPIQMGANVKMSGNVTTGGSPAVSAALVPVQAVISQMQNTAIVGEGISVNGLNSVLHAGTQLTATYQWNFGDPSGRFNQLTGWNAGHVYDNPGTYTITLRVTDAAGQISTATSQVYIQADNRPMIYVDTNGSDSNGGASPDQAVQSVVRAFQIAGSYSKIEFHRGETFDLNQTVYINGNDQYVGAYGDGTSPVINRGPGDGSVTFFLNSQSVNTTIQDLTFDTPNAVTSGPAPKIGSQTIWAWGTNVVVRNNTFLNTDDAINASMRPTGVIIMDNSAPLITGIRGYFCWVDGTDWTIVGNNVANSTREHDIRSSSMGTDRVLIADNTLSNPTRADDPDEVSKCTINIREGRDIYITGNTLNQGTVGFGPGPWTPDSDEVANLVIQGNFIHDSQLYLAGAVHHALVQNNVLDDTGQSQIHILPNDPDYADRHMLDVTIDHNTGINSGTSGQFLEISAEDLPGVLTLTNNLYVAPNLDFSGIANAAVLVTAPDLNDFNIISGNIWPASNAPSGAVNFVNGSWYANGGQTPAQWNANSNVQNDQFQDVALPAGVYQTSLNGVTAGSSGLAVAS